MKTAKLMDGKHVRDIVFKDIAKRVEHLKKNSKTPNLVVIQVGDHEASSIYIKHKLMAAQALGINASVIHLDKNISFDKLKQSIVKLNLDEKVNGILVQFPLPKEFDEYEIMSLINPSKDVDGLHPLNQGLNFIKNTKFSPKPCTPSGIMQMFKTYDISLSGKKVALIGRSNIVGKPLAAMLINESAIVSVLHTKVAKNDFDAFIGNADIVITAAGIMDLVSPDIVKNDVIIIDVGIHRTPEGKVRGDIDYKKFTSKASWISPVPGGVGPMTIAMLMNNIVSLTEHYSK